MSGRKGDVLGSENGHRSTWSLEEFKNSSKCFFCFSLLEESYGQINTWLQLKIFFITDYAVTLIQNIIFHIKMMGSPSGLR